MWKLGRSMNPMSGSWTTWVLAILVVSCAYFYKLGGAPLWGDEAGTGIFARNVLHSGFPTGFDGRNLSIYDGGTELNADLVVSKIPWIQFYVGALSLRLWGDDAHGLRVLFAALGLLALFPLGAVLRSRVPSPLLVATLVLVMPQVVLFQRNARYYSLLTLAFACLVWVVCRDGMSRVKRLVFASACMVLLFHAHPVAAAACGLALVLLAIWRRSNFQVYGAACAMGVASWLVWTAYVGPSMVAPQLFMDFQSLPPTQWVGQLVRSLGAAFHDMDAVQGMPVLAWGLCLGWALRTRPRLVTEFLRDPLVSFVVLTLVVHVLAVALLFGTETHAEHSLLRYMPHLIVFCMVLLYILLGRWISNARVFALVCVTLAATNLASLSFWTDRAEGVVPVSWWPATYREIVFPQPDAVDAVLAVVQNDPGRASDLDTLLVIPPWLREVAIFYLGHAYIVTPDLEPGSASERAVRTKIGQQAYARFSVVPKWVLHEASPAPDAVSGYTRIQIPVHRVRPDDGSRPELTRHTFYQAQELGHISIYRRLE